MFSLEKLCRSFTVSLMLATAALADETRGGAATAYRPGEEGEAKGGSRGSPLPSTFVAGEGAAFKVAAEPELSSEKGTKGAEPIGALPARVATGTIASFDAADAVPGAAKERDPVSSLPSSVSAGEATPYGAEGGSQPSASKATPRAGPIGVSAP